ncbi:lanthionine synthetase LanC family protein [Streptomyces sp. NBRC 109706]|uniref:class III lanthionine synthetase LanKC N-terminal domain-containing protein n=1 Tax=Streptomyces sp. NBRC 109706 TaxID=1550035 RepID=UPI0007816EC6|nr:lanthionine synthetase LanC family protein [Streptomyces sp. NBRC 109706]
MSSTAPPSAPPGSVAELVRRSARAAGRRVRLSRWLYVTRPTPPPPATAADPAPEHGWKLHIAARPSTLRATLERALPTLLRTDCDFKSVPDEGSLAELNSTANNNPGAVGKALTVYPPQEPAALRALADALADALTGLTGPTIRSDRRVRGDAPLHYRYGPFRARYLFDADGQPELVMVGPDGQRHRGIAGPEFDPPPWANDPFAQPTATPVNEPLLGGRYRPTSGIRRAARGDVYRAVDTATGQLVVVKEAFAWVGERPEGYDVRGRLRNERRVLQLLDGSTDVPSVIDHFRHGEDEFLVIGDLGGRTLGEVVADEGLFVDPADLRAPLVARADGRTLIWLARALLALLDQVHAAGVVVRDLAPKNVLVGTDGRLRLIDFDIAAHAGVQCAGHTPGYAPGDQWRNPPARVEDDYHALGATLFHATTGLQPSVMADGQRPDTEATLACLATVHPALTDGSATGALALLPRLLSDRPDERAAAATELRTERISRPPTTTVPEPNLDVFAAQLRDGLRRFADRPADPDGEPEVPGVYRGTAGVALALSRQRDPVDRRRALCLARRAARPGPAGQPPPGLAAGGTGIAVALATTIEVGDELTDAVRRLASPDPAALPSGAEVVADHTHGLAGIGVGHLRLAALTGDRRHLDVADVCLRRLLAGDHGHAEPPDAAPGTGAGVAHGFAHGTAGLVDFALAARAILGADPRLDRTLDAWWDQLAAATGQSIADTRGPLVRPLAGSWCQGLAGMGRALLHAGRALDRPESTELALAAGEAAFGLAPRMAAVGQCCGLAGLGEFLLDLAEAADDPTPWQARARRVATLLLLRKPPARDASWAQGDAGLLTFLHRLHPPAE